MDSSDIFDFSSVEAKARAEWENEKTYEPEIDKKKKKKFVTAAFPYPNSPQHIGHGRTYTTTDVHARYLRLKGYNVIFPMGFHVTGTPIIAMAKRISERDKELYEIFDKIYGIPEAITEKLTDPTALVTYFSKEIEQGMREMGYSIDWRRKFYSFDKQFNKFIEWQFKKLRDSGYIVQGEHPIAWCPADKQAVGAHDTKGDADPELEEVIAVKFAFEDGYLATMTYRHETIYGVTNIWVSPNAKYVKAKYNGDNIYLAKESAVALAEQLGLKIEKELDSSYFTGKTARNAVTKKDVPIWAAQFVDPATGTGVVMSVPAHSLFDYLALRDMGKENIDMPQVLETPDYGKMPSRDVVERWKLKNQQDPNAEQANNEFYKKEAHEGIMIIDSYKGMKSAEAKEKIKTELRSSGNAFGLWIIANAPVYCRCGSQVMVNILKNQWFIDYGNEQWKENAKECLAAMTVIPEKTRDDYLRTIDWLKQKACARASGLGTKFPFDKSKMIEALSDSTIYIAFYCFAHIVKDMKEDELNEEFFDYVLLGKEPKAKLKTENGKPKHDTQDPKHKTENSRPEYWDEAREQFTYWYGEDSYHSGADLVRNHLPFHIFNHAAIFEKKYWPKQFVTNGFVLMDGKKMSKSMGNILPLRKAIKEYGADVIRFSVVSGADLTQDTDFNKSVAEGTRNRLEFVAKLVSGVSKANGRKKNNQIDKWLLSRMHRKIKNAETLYEKIALRELALEIFYDVYNDLQWYLKRTEKENYGTAIKEFLKTWSVLIQPFMPHVAEEFWHMLGEKKTISEFPKHDEKKIDAKAEKGEELIRQTLEDAVNISTLLGKKPEKVYIYVAGEWKRKLYNIIRTEKAFDKVMKASSQDAELRARMQDVQRITKQLIKNAFSLQEIETENWELKTLKDAEQFLGRELGCTVNVASDSNAKHERAKNAIPNKPAIVLE